MLIELSEDEKTRIQKQAWTKESGVDPDSMIVLEGSRYRLRHQADGACVFLDASGKCRIHARFGEESKPRACRLFPLTLHPMGKKLMTGLRFSCPSAVANSGKPLTEQVSELRKLAELVVPDDFTEFPPPPVIKSAVLDWSDFLRFVACLDKTLAEDSQPLAIKFQRALHWLKEVERARFDSITGREADEILGALAKSASREISAFSRKAGSPSRFGRLLFRTLVFTYARKDDMSQLAAGGAYRFRMLCFMLRFAWASGTVPQIHCDLKPANFSEIEKSFEPLSNASEALLTRFFRVKVQSLHFCGRPFYDMPLIEGFQNLALLFPVILWLARWHAAGEKRSNLTEADIAKAISIADHHHGYSPILGMPWSRQRVRLLNQRNDIERLCGAFV